MALKMMPAQIAAIKEHGERDYPGECCGALLGRIEGEVKRVDVVLPLANVHEDGAARRFRIDPQEMFRLESEARGRRLSVVGFYHSHPDHPARPSEYDRVHAWPVYSYAIVSVAKGKAGEMTSWVLLDDRSGYEAEEIETIA